MLFMLFYKPLKELFIPDDWLSLFEDLWCYRVDEFVSRLDVLTVFWEVKWARLFYFVWEDLKTLSKNSFLELERSVEEVLESPRLFSKDSDIE